MTYEEIEQMIDSLIGYIDDNASQYDEFKNKNDRELADMSLYVALKNYKDINY